MREYLFRGKRKDNGEWLEGFALFADNKAFIFNNVKVEFLNGYNEYRMNFTLKEVIPETVGQFTGLTDKNGKKVFEGDIVIVDLILNPKKYVGVVVYNKDCFGVDIKGITPVQNCLAYSKENGEFEVVGNIHDNTELL